MPREGCFLASLPLVHRRISASLVMRVGVQSFRSQLFAELWPALADADPLGVNQSVTFDEVGGLDDRRSRCVLGIAISSLSQISML